MIDSLLVLAKEAIERDLLFILMGLFDLCFSLTRVMYVLILKGLSSSIIKRKKDRSLSLSFSSLYLQLIRKRLIDYTNTLNVRSLTLIFIFLYLYKPHTYIVTLSEKRTLLLFIQMW